MTLPKAERGAPRTDYGKKKGKNDHSRRFNYIVRGSPWNYFIKKIPKQDRSITESPAQRLTLERELPCDDPYNVDDTNRWWCTIYDCTGPVASYVKLSKNSVTSIYLLNWIMLGNIIWTSPTVISGRVLLPYGNSDSKGTFTDSRGAI